MTEWRSRAQQPCRYGTDNPSLTILEAGFAGEESVLFRFVGANGYQAYVALARRGDLVVMIDANPVLSQALVRSSAKAASDRLCAATRC
jgi:hypothetical protein